MANQKTLSSGKLIVILGPTASGKSDLAVKIARKFNGEIISADSRQVYKGMDIGTGKVPRDKNPKSDHSPFPMGWVAQPRPLLLRRGRGCGEIRNSKQIQNLKFQISKQPYFYKGIEHHLIDVTSPKRRFTVVQYRKLALKAINKIFKKSSLPTKKMMGGKIPILCGGTGFYIQAVVDGITIPEVKPDWRLRSNLNKLSTEDLYQILKKLDPKRAKIIERKNPRRIIRAIEIAKKIGYVPILKKKPLPYPVLMLGIKKEKKELNSLIRKRFFQWLKQGFLKEVLKLRKLGLSWQRIEDFGIHYRVAVQYLKKEISEQEFIEKSLIELQNYAKRQMTWFKQDKRIKWIKNYKEAKKLVRKFLNQKLSLF